MFVSNSVFCTWCDPDELCWLVILLDLNQEEAADMSVCLCSLFCIVLMMLETFTKLKHLLVSSSFIRPPANPLSLSLSLSVSISLFLSLPRSCATFTYSPWFQWLCADFFSLSLALSPVCIYLSLYPPSNLSVSLHTHLFYFQYKQLSFLFPHALRL